MVEIFQNQSLKIDLQEDDTHLRVYWTGRSDLDTPRTQLMSVYDSLIRICKGKKMIMDFRGVEYLNSATIGSIINLMKILKSAEILADFVYNSKSNWQPASFKPLEIISRPLTNIKVYGEPLG